MDNRHQKSRSIQQKYFQSLLIIAILSFLADILSSMYGISDWIFPFSVFGNYMEVILNTILITLYFSYVCLQITDINLVLKRFMNISLGILSIICCAMVVSTVFNEKIFYYDEAQIYHRGPFFWVPMLIMFIMMVMIEVFVLSQKSKMEANHYKSLVLFLIFPLIGWGLQLLIFGLPFALISVTFAAQVIFTNIQNRSMNTDYLTGVFNRQALDGYIKNKIEREKKRHSFSAILLDIDSFKNINDSYGHHEGDRVLVNTAKLLRASVGYKDFIARYGGDEFCVVFHTDDPATLEAAVKHIYKKLNDFNKNSKKQYQLSFSIGGAVFDSSKGTDADEFFKEIDKKMYDAKCLRKGTSDTLKG
ncbi:MAG: diguanylate cyclase [Lachnospiraceae bacterium]|nr:diguanylate cyclase [Lachnospiraceae bacterium]